MTNFYPCAKHTLVALALGVSSLAFAGNIPQYKVTKTGGTPYTEFSDGTVIPCSWGEGTTVIFPNEHESPNDYSAPGFPIGFDFRFGGRLVNQFAVSSVGELYLGKDMVNFGGDAFSIGMTPVKFGVSKAEISYKTTGDAGNRVFTLQLKRAVIRETSSYKGTYSIQIRLYEADGKAEIAFKEIETTGGGNGFDTGIHGWDGNDAMQLTATGLDNPISISEKLKANMLEPDSYINWDEDDYDQYYSPVFVFTPESDTVAPANAPADLVVEQSGKNLNISCSRAEGAAATVILVSETPFTDADLPVDGETFRASYRDTNSLQIFPTSLGNAKALYYGNAESISVSLDNIVDGTTYYVKALSVNGYPAYNRANTADKVFATTQAAPSVLNAVATGAKSVDVTVSADCPVIVAATTEVNPGYQQGYTGVFGTPSNDVKVGDMLPGGGKVVYVGDPATFSLGCNENELTFLRAWTLKGDVVSATARDAAALPDASLPFEPGLENYPYGEQLMFWTASENQFIPWRRAYQGDAAIYAVTTEDNMAYLATPLMNLDSSVKLTFEFAMETAREAADTSDGGVAIPQGSDPGSFGDTGFLKILDGKRNVYKTITSYSGTMVGAGDGTNEDGSSSYETVEVDMPAIGNDGRIMFQFSTPKFTKLYLRNIKIERTGEAPSAPASSATGLTADEDRNAVITVNCKRGEDAENTLVLFSEKPFTDAETPVDGTTYVAGTKLGNASVLYYGNDEDIVCVTNNVVIIPDYDTDYYIRAISANNNPLYNNENVAEFTYHTLPDMAYPENLSAMPNDDVVIVEADRAPNATGTILLISNGDSFEGQLEDGVEYKPGDTVGNATVVYRGEDEHISTQTQELAPENTFCITGYSYNSRGWYGDVSRSVTVSTTGVEEIGLDAVDFANAEVFTVDGIRINVKSAAELPAGIYIINGRKVVVK